MQKLKTLLVAVFLIGFFATGNSAGSYQREEPFILFTIPKSGTTMAQKYFSLIEDTLDAFDLCVSTQHFNLPFSSYSEDQMDYIYVMKKVVLIRDLRDVFCSLADMLDKSLDRDPWVIFTRKEKIKKLIGFAPPIPRDLLQNDYANTWCNTMRSAITAAVEILSIPNTCVIRYEMLVGPKGGIATESEMHQEMKKINDFLGVTLSDEKYSYVKDQLFGGSSTFNKGKVGPWKREFDEELKNLFKLKYGQELIDLGYEENFDW
ncbi:MAG: hypothetical protein KR126chlam1_00947 [Chlamydiae bacterium]|nr:hypothetical protein [Chlamydiota bacterium]